MVDFRDKICLDKNVHSCYSIAIIRAKICLDKKCLSVYIKCLAIKCLWCAYYSDDQGQKMARPKMSMDRH